MKKKLKLYRLTKSFLKSTRYFHLLRFSVNLPNISFISTLKVLYFSKFYFYEKKNVLLVVRPLVSVSYTVQINV